MLIDPQQWPALSRLLDEALSLEPEARASWLAALSPQDVVYREQLRTLLQHAAAAETRDFLDILPGIPESVVADTPGEAEGSLVPGAVVGPYVIEQRIGSGGMGAVWLARRGDGVIKRPVALKLPHAGPFGRVLAERFATERNILAELNHPNIARLYDAGFSADGQPFLALEYVAGEPVTKYCDEHRLDVVERLRLFQQILRAVQYAHGSLVIHRDIKPSNVIVGNDGRAMLLDFGVAKLIAVDAGDNGRTQFGGGIAPLTPDYASPEQISARPVTTASDIYSLGVLLFELLTGERPYQLERTSRAALEEAILSVDPKHLAQVKFTEEVASARGTTPKGLAGALRGDLDTIVIKALKKSADERYATADAFSQDIERYLRGEPVTARKDGGWYRAGKFVSRHKLPVLAGGVALAVILLTAAVALFEANDARSEARNAKAERDRALALSARNESVAEFLNMLITESAGTSKPVTIGDMVARSEDLVRSEYRDNPEDRAAVLGMLGMYYYTAEKQSRAESLMREAVATIKTSKDDDLRRKLTCNYALTLQTAGKAPEAIQTIHAIIDEPQVTAQQAAQCFENLAIIAVYGHDAADAVKYGNLALERLDETPHPSPGLQAVYLGVIGLAERQSGRNDVAEEFYERALLKFQRAGRDGGLDSIALRSNWAVVSDATGNPKRALELLDAALRLAAQNDPAAPPLPSLVFNHARALENVGRFREARDGYLQCLSQAERTDTPAKKVPCLFGLASVSLELADRAAADSYLATASATAGKSVPPGSPVALRIQDIRGLIALGEGRLVEARENMDAVIADGKNITLTIDCLLTRAEVSLDEGKLPAAEADARQALSLAQSAQGGVPHSSRTGLAWLMLGRLSVKRGDIPGARTAFATAVEHLSSTVDAEHPQLLLARQLEHG